MLWPPCETSGDSYFPECTFADTAEEEEVEEVDFAVKVDGLLTYRCVSCSITCPSRTIPTHLWPTTSSSHDALLSLLRTNLLTKESYMPRPSTSRRKVT